VAGGVANTLLHVLGYGVGDSIVDKKQISIAKKIARKSNVFVPLDVVVGNKKGTDWRVVPIERHPHVICKKGEAIFDVGPATIERLRISLPSAKTIVWNGALGLFEQSPYHMGTYAFARDLAACRTAFTVAGGGETIEILTALRLHSKISFVSTGGGAMLEFLSNKKLPGISVLERK
jgi:phosphoglycerate kinase